MVDRAKIQDRLKYYVKVRVNKTSFIMIFVSILGYLVWLYAFPMFGPIIAGFLVGLKALDIEKGRVLQIFLFSMMVSSFVGGFLVDKLRRRVILIWIPTVAASLLTFSFIWLTKIVVVFPFSLLLGFVAGIIPAAWGAYFADNTLPEDRGRIMGISAGLSMPIAYLFLISEPFEIGGSANSELIIIGALYLVTLLTLILRPQEKAQEIFESRGKRGAGAKQLVLYASPIFLFYLVAGILLSIVFPTIQDHVRNEVFYLIWSVPFLFGSIIAGILLDMVGRKLPTIVGLAITGVSVAILGIIGIRMSHVCIVLLAVGFSFVTITSFIIWADLAPTKGRGIYYGVGFGLMASATMLGLMSVGNRFGSVPAQAINSYMLFSSVALFLCIPPLIVAEDALPKEVIEKRQMQEHLQRARERMRKK